MLSMVVFHIMDCTPRREQRLGLLGKVIGMVKFMM